MERSFPCVPGGAGAGYSLIGEACSYPGKTGGLAGGVGRGLSLDFMAALRAFNSKEELMSGCTRRGEAAHPSHMYTRVRTLLRVKMPLTVRPSIDSLEACKGKKEKGKKGGSPARLRCAFRSQKRSDVENKDWVLDLGHRVFVSLTEVFKAEPAFKQGLSIHLSV